MTELLTAAQMRAIEHAAIASGAVTGLELMERAGRGVVEAIFAQWPELAPDAGLAGGQPPDPRDISAQKKERLRAVVLCGPGNNGGDGFVVARLLKEAGWDVEVFLYGEAERLPPDAKVNYERW
ncbi:MAG: bifunctional ADP-dependent NAD(P)H-hydrate dehydratase/NAD(P)H-hydrate epimerase, partial [Yoonia sp.]|uniref:NAD(P)H-hydrate epimerase n=1 Tax=Yoonia sp. TaxID=2212373 RepID=UPI00273DBC59